MIYVLYFFHVTLCLFLILVVLLQQGKGADLSVFGGGSTQAAFGARGAATLLHKLTVGCFVMFIITTVTIGILQRSGRSSSIMSDVELPAAETTIPEPAATTEGSGLDFSLPAAETSADSAPSTDEVPSPPAGRDDSQPDS